MQRRHLFWGAFLILLGMLFLLGNVLGISMWLLIWPSLLIALGIWILLGRPGRWRSAVAEPGAVALEGAGRARLHIHHGAGRLTIGSGTAPDQLLAGTFSGGLHSHTSREGDLLDVELRPREAGPWTWGPHGIDWSFNLSKEVPLSLGLETGASDMTLDLSGLRLTDLRLKTGASSTYLTLPASAGYSRAVIESGAASVTVQVPAGVAAQVRIRGALTGISVDTNRFPYNGQVYRSPDYDTAANKVDLDVQAGVGSISVR
jgi:hypothetical protein